MYTLKRKRRNCSLVINNNNLLNNKSLGGKLLLARFITNDGTRLNVFERNALESKYDKYAERVSEFEKKTDQVLEKKEVSEQDRSNLSELHVKAHDARMELNREISEVEERLTDESCLDDFQEKCADVDGALTRCE